ncbi:hypothetical protein GDO81_000139 [Engystomops pustulosus]|uniref:Uncharacterized protein n=1 Tax=Engystomops pustulosus TaxID=76066 RepID=A0AAV7D1R5_ENGPU|nr:hypothetical protein GDO81_000139 [Engystomops pustulosus]
MAGSVYKDMGFGYIPDIFIYKGTLMCNNCSKVLLYLETQIIALQGEETNGKIPKILIKMIFNMAHDGGPNISPIAMDWILDPMLRSLDTKETISVHSQHWPASVTDWLRGHFLFVFEANRKSSATSFHSQHWPSSVTDWLRSHFLFVFKANRKSSAGMGEKNILFLRSHHVSC